MKILDLSFESQADAVYIKFSDRNVEDTRKIDETTIIDLDKDGEVIGRELLNASSRFSGLSELSIDFTGQEATV